MSSIDQRVVEMQFDNAQFEKGIQTSVKSLDQLKKGLNLEQSAKGLAELGKAGSSFSLAGISESVSAIGKRFSAMGIVGMTALQNITNSAYNCGKRMASALTVEPVKMGFQEYETQINAVQTILANTSDAMDKAGYSEQQRLDVVNGKLDELNAYADKTIYNFTEMTRNIGTFTAAGVELDTAVNSIQGIANLAAVSGSTSQQASTAMYQLSQAISTGTVRLMDWNSVVNAGMGGELFQKALTRTASAMGVTGDEANDMFAKLKTGEVSFRDSLQSGWLSSDILTTTLEQMSMDFEKIAKDNGLLLEDGSADIEAAKNKMRDSLKADGYVTDEVEEIIKLAEMATDAATKVKTVTQLFDTLKESMQSGWTATWGLIVGDFNESRDLFTSISDYFGEIINKSAESRNAVITDWKTLGGRQDMIDGFWNIVHAIGNIVDVFKKSFAEFFPPATGEQLYGITKGIKELTERVKTFTEDEEKMGKLQKVFRGIGAALDLVRQGIVWIWNGFKQLIGAAEPAAGSLLDLAARIGDFITGIRDAVKNSETFQKILNGVSKAIGAVRDFIVSVGKALGRVLGNLWEKLKGSRIFTKFGEYFGSFLNGIPAAIEKLKSWGKGVIDYVKNSELLQNLWENTKTFFEPAVQQIAGFAKGVKDAFHGLFSSKTGEKLKTWFADFKVAFVGGFEQFKQKAAEIWHKIKSFFERLFGGQGGELGELTEQAKFEVTPTVDTSNWFTTIRDKVAEVWGNVKKFLSGFFKTTVPNFFTKTVPDMLAYLPRLLSGFIEELKMVDWGAIIKPAIGLYAAYSFGTLINGIGNVGKGIKGFGKGIKGFGDGFAGISEGIQSSLAGISGSIQSSLAGVSGGFVDVENGLSVFLKNFNTKTQIIKKQDSLGNNVLKIASAIAILVGAIYVLGKMESSQVTTGLIVLGALAVVLIALSEACKTFDSGNTKALLQAAAALALLVIPLKVLGGTELAVLIQGGATIAVLLTMLGLFIKKSKGLGKNTGLVGIAVALNLLIIPIKVLGSMDWLSLVKAGVGIAALLTMLGLFITKSKGLGKDTGLIGIAVALNLLIIPIKILGSMDWLSLIKAGLGIAALLTMLSLFMTKSKGLGKDTGLIGIAVALNLLIIPIKVLGAMDWLSLVKAGLGIAALLTMLSLFMTKSKGLGKGTGLIVIAAALNLLIIPIRKLSKMKGSELLKGVGAIAVLLLSLAAIQKGAGGSTIKKIAAMMIPLLGIAGLLVVFSFALKQIEDVPWYTIAAFSAGIVAMVVVMTGAIALLQNVNPIGAAKAAVALALMAVGIGAAIAILGGFIGGAISGFSDDLFRVGSNLDAYGKLVSGLKMDKIQNSITAMKDLAGMAVEVGGTDTSKLEGFASQLSLLGARLSLFSLLAGGVNLTSSSNAKAMVDDIGYIAEKMKEMETKGLNLNDLSIALTNVGAGIQLYALSCKEAEGNLPDGEVDMGPINKMLTSIAGIEVDESTIKQIASYAEGGGNDLTSFALGLTALGTAMTDYKGKITGLSESDVKSANSLLEMINGLQKDLPREDSTSIIGYVAGKKQTLAMFAENIVVLGGAMSSFAGCFADANTATLAERAVAVVQSLADIQNELDNYGGIARFFEGEKDLGTLGTNINVLGDGFSEFVGSLDNFKNKQTLTNKAVEVIESLVDIQRKLDETDGLAQLFTGKKNIATFGLNLKTFADRFSDFCTKIEGVTIPANLDTVEGVVDKFADVAIKLNKIDAYDLSNFIKWIGEDLKFFFGSDGISGITIDQDKLNSLVDFVNCISDVAVKLNNIKPVDIYNFIEYLGNDLNTFFGSKYGIGNITIDQSKLNSLVDFVNCISDVAVKLNGIQSIDRTLLQGVLDTLSEITIPNFDTEGMNAAVAFITSLDEGLQNGETQITSTAPTLSKAGTTALQGTYDTWYQTGKNMAQSVANGMNGKVGVVRNAGLSVGRTMLGAIHEVLQMHSPSKVGLGIGRNWDLSLASGMDAYARVVGQSATNVGREALNAGEAMLGALSADLAGGMDNVPAIRPVIDLSDVQRGVSEIDNLFNADRSFSASMYAGESFYRNARSMNFDGARIVGGNSNREVVEAIQDLSDRFNRLSEAVSGMQLVLDTGTLVGQIDTKVDNRLGVLASRRERGN